MDHRVGPPAVIGHEMSGRIGAVGDAVTDWAVGDPVTVDAAALVRRLPRLPRRATRTSASTSTSSASTPRARCRRRGPCRPTSWSDFPTRCPSQRAALVEPTAVAVHDVGRAALVAGEHVVVVGGGPVGLLIACVARAADAQVLVLEVDAYRRGVAEQLGLHRPGPDRGRRPGGGGTSGPPAPARTSPSRSPPPSPAWTPPSVYSACEAAWWWSASTPSPGRSICTRSSGVSSPSSAPGSTNASTSQPPSSCVAARRRPRRRPHLPGRTAGQGRGRVRRPRVRLAGHEGPRRLPGGLTR